MVAEVMMTFRSGRRGSHLPLCVDDRTQPRRQVDRCLRIGTLQISENNVKVDVELGLLMSAMSGMIQSEIERSLDKALS